MEDVQVSRPDDYVIATGKNYTIKFFVNLICKNLKSKLDGRGQV